MKYHVQRQASRSPGQVQIFFVFAILDTSCEKAISYHLVVNPAVILANERIKKEEA
jgi:hypothetical protein